MKCLLEFIVFLLKLDVIFVVVKLGGYIPILFRFFNGDSEETYGTLVGYEERPDLDKYYYDFSTKSYVLRKKRYSYSAIVNYTVNGKQYQNIEKLSHRPYPLKKIGSKVKIIYMKDEPEDGTIKYNLILDTVIFCVLAIIYMFLKIYG